jgi:hypothetical protein
MYGIDLLVKIKELGHVLCCNIREISSDNFDTGHIIAIADGGGNNYR